MVGFHPVHNGLGTRRHRVGGLECRPLVNLGPGAAAVGTALNNIALKVLFGVGAGRPGNFDGAAALDDARHVDGPRRSRGRVRGHAAIIRDQEGRGKDQSGADATGAGGNAAAVAATGIDVPHVVGVAAGRFWCGGRMCRRGRRGRPMRSNCP